MVRLTKILRSGAEGVAADVPRAIALYESALRENAPVWATGGLFLTLLDGVDDDGSVDKSKALETLRGAVEEKNEVNGMVAVSVLYARHSVSEMGADMEASRMMMRRAAEEEKQLQIPWHVVRLWKGVRDGIDGFEQDVEFANEIEGYCVEWGIELSE